jgi:hypothetical protein
VALQQIFFLLIQKPLNTYQKSIESAGLGPKHQQRSILMKNNVRSYIGDKESRRFKTLTLLAALQIIALIIVPAHASTPPAPIVCGQWKIVPSPNASPDENRFRSVSAVAANDVWAVGFHDADPGPDFFPRALIEHWDGASWSVVPAPSVGVSGDYLYGVAAVSANDVWAVGFSSSILGEAQALILHWDGSHWVVVPSPTFTGGSALWAVGAVGAANVWAVGGRVVGAPGPTGGTLTLNWDGSNWNEIPSPNPPNAAENNDLRALTIISADDIWVVGENDVPGNFKHALTLHWDGTRWRLVRNPHTNSNTDSELVAVAGASADDVWASGVVFRRSGVKPLFMHRTGSSWTPVASPGGVAPYFGGVSGLVALAADDVWAVGRTMAHWDGARWSLVNFPKPSPDAELHAVAKVSDCDLWAVGEFYDSNADTTVTLIERLTPGP